MHIIFTILFAFSSTATLAEEHAPFGTVQMVSPIPVKKSSDEPGFGIGLRFVPFFEVLPNLELGPNFGFIYGFEKDLFGAKTQTMVGSLLFSSRYHFREAPADPHFFLNSNLGLTEVRTYLSEAKAIPNKTTKLYGLGFEFGFGYTFSFPIAVGVDICFLDMTAHDIFNYSSLLFSVSI